MDSNKDSAKLNKKLSKRTLIIAVILSIVLLLLGTFSTLGWFSTQTIVEVITSYVPGDEGNNIVKTGIVKGKTNEQSINLEVSGKGGADFAAAKVCDIVSANEKEFERLMPVSTADLSKFIGSKVSTGSSSAVMQVVDDANYYHGRFYVRASGSGFSEDTKIKLYLDSSIGDIVIAEGEIINAARLGLTIGGTNPVIISASDNENTPEGRENNTYLNGELVPEGNVLTADNSGTVSYVKDPSKSINSFTFNSEDPESEIPQEYITEIELNKIYQMDVYFYLEGCDPDCTNAVSQQDIDLQIGLYGIVEQ